MNNRQIDSILTSFLTNSTVVQYQGVFASNELPDFSKMMMSSSWCLVVNTDPNSQEGTHWISILWDKKVKTLEYFCSYGTSLTDLPQSIRYFLMTLKTKKILYNPHQLQKLCSAVCGQFCIYHILCRTLFDMSFQSFLNQFDPNDRSSNDYLVSSIISPLFTHSQKDLAWIEHHTRQCLKATAQL